MKVLFFKIPESRHSQEGDTGRQLVKQDKPLGKSWQNEDKSYLLGMATGRANSRSEVRLKSQPPSGNWMPKHWKLSPWL